MPVGTFVQPDFESDTGTEYKTNIDNSIAAMARVGGAFAPHEQDTPDMTVRIDAGALWVGGEVVEHVAQDSATITAPTTNPRIDRIVIDALSGDVAVITGTEAASPSAPAITSGKLPICQVLLDNSPATTAIDNSLITDERVLGSGGGQAIPVNGIYANLGGDPATELGYGTWQILAGPLYSSHYPPAQSSTYVKATSAYSSYYAYLTTDPSKSLIGSWSNQWLSSTKTNLRFHIDAGLAVVLKRLYYENGHNTGGSTDVGAQNFTLWGSNNAAAFADTTWDHDTNWTAITTDISAFLEHAAVDQPDPQYVVCTPAVAYRYYAIKIADGYGHASYLGVRRFELQTVIPTMWVRTA